MDDDDSTKRGGETGGGTSQHQSDVTSLQLTGGTSTHQEPRRKQDFIGRMIKRITMDKYGRGDFFTFSYKDLIQILIRIKATLQAEPPLLKCPIPCVIVGDVHGQYFDLLRLFAKFSNSEKPGWLTQRYVFLGDYVDRGKQSLEVICLVFLLKIRFPNSFFLLRGNHECKPINRTYGFKVELEERFDNDHGSNLFHMFNEAFSHMPVACLVADNILCMHGGISPKLESLDDIMKIPKPLVDPNSNELACDLLWADPMLGLSGYKPNKTRGVSVHFGEDVLIETMERLNLKLIVRGHQMMMNGYNFFGGKRLVTVFTAASYYPDKANHGAAMFVTADGRFGFRIFAPSTKEQSGEKVFRGDHDISNKNDLGYIESKEEP